MYSIDFNFITQKNLFYCHFSVDISNIRIYRWAQFNGNRRADNKRHYNENEH